jgi:methylated-DNA-[protein]-cysteine S-methyltransferase
MAMPQLSLHSPLGDLTVSEEDGAIVALDWGRGSLQQPTPLLREAARQLQDYFDGTRRTFQLPLAPAFGTPFQRQVWAALCAIPYGETRSYIDIARALGHKGARAIGQANGRNCIPILIPCHRVVAADGSLGGYSGDGGPETKHFLLTLEAHALGRGTPA